MGWNFFRSIRLGGGFRLNLSKKGIEVSTGIPGVRLSTGPRGKRFQLTIPGTGIYYRKTWGSGKNRNLETEELDESEITTKETSNDSGTIDWDSVDPEKLEKKLLALHIANGLTYLKANHFEEAIFSFRKGLKISRDSADCHLLLGIIYYRMANYRKAIKHLKKADYFEYALGTDIKYLNFKMQIAISMESYFAYPIRLSFNLRSVMILRSMCYDKKHMRHKAIRILRGYLGVERNPKIIFLIMEKMINIGEAKEAFDIYQENANFLENAHECRILLFKIYMDKALLDRAEEMSNRLIKSDLADDDLSLLEKLFPNEDKFAVGKDEKEAEKWKSR